MLTALEQGVKGDKWFRLNDKVFAERNLLAAFQKVAKKKGGAGVDHETVYGFERRLPDVILELSDALKSGRFTPKRSAAYTYRSRAPRRRDRWAFPRSVIEWSRLRW
jgi:hypothetical protein